MKNNQPLVSVGIPVYNAEPYLEKLLNSILNQSYKNIEVIISNNCSNDYSRAICEKYSRKDSRIKYIERSKFYSAINNQMKVFNESKGDYFMMAGADDFYDKKWIANLLKIAIKKKTLVFGKVQYVDSSGKPQQSTANLRNLKFIGYDYWRLIKFTYTPSIYGKMILFWSLYPRLKLKKILKESMKKKWATKVDEVFVYSSLKYFNIFNYDVLFYKRNHNKSHNYVSKKNNNKLNFEKKFLLKKIQSFFKAIFIISNYSLYFKLSPIKIKLFLIASFPIGYIYHVINSFFSLIVYKFKK